MAGFLFLLDAFGLERTRTSLSSYISSWGTEVASVNEVPWVTHEMLIFPDPDIEGGEGSLG